MGLCRSSAVWGSPAKTDPTACALMFQEFNRDHQSVGGAL